MDKVIPPNSLPTAHASALAPLLSRLLELHSKPHLDRLASQCQEALVSLPDADRPTSYEGLLDVAKFCIEDEPGWSNDDKAVLIGGHPRIGARPGTTMSQSSQSEQKATEVDRDADTALAQLNLIYERRYPSLRYVTYVNGRPRAAIADELGGFLGKPTLDQAPSEIDPEVPSKEEVEWADKLATPVAEKGGEAWEKELSRGIDALLEIAMDRSSKIKEDEYATPSRVTPFFDENEAFDQPFLTLDKFKELAKASPLLTAFFETDLPSSFYLVPPPPPQETPREALATLAAVAVTGGGGGDATRKRVRGLLGGLWGEVADRAGKVTGRETRSGPRPAFGREETLRGEELRAKGSKGNEAARQNASGTSGTDLEDAEESLKMATQRLTDADRSHFVIDEPTAAGDAEGEDEDGEEDLGLGMERLELDDEGALQSSEKDKALAKGEEELHRRKGSHISYRSSHCACRVRPHNLLYSRKFDNTPCMTRT